MRNAYVRARLNCPACGLLAVANEDIIFNSIGERTKNSHTYGADLADEMTGLSLTCVSCGKEFFVTNVDVRLSDGSVLEY